MGMALQVPERTERLGGLGGLGRKGACTVSAFPVPSAVGVGVGQRSTGPACYFGCCPRLSDAGLDAVSAHLKTPESYPGTPNCPKPARACNPGIEDPGPANGPAPAAPAALSGLSWPFHSIS